MFSSVLGACVCVHVCVCVQVCVCVCVCTLRVYIITSIFLALLAIIFLYHIILCTLLLLCCIHLPHECVGTTATFCFAFASQECHALVNYSAAILSIIHKCTYPCSQSWLL